MIINHTNTVFDTIHVIRPATIHDMAQYVTRSEITKWSPYCGENTKTLKRVAGNRNKYWYCQCTKCDKVYVVRSDHLAGKRCRCQK